MIVNEVLKEKWRTQEKLAEEAGYDVRKYAEIVHQTVEQMVKKRGTKLKYSNRVPKKKLNLQGPIASVP